MYPLFQAAVGGFGGKTEVEFHVQATRNHVGGAGAALDIGNLKTGGWKISVALIPLGGHQFGQRRREGVDGVYRQMRIGDVALLAFDG